MAGRAITHHEILEKPGGRTGVVCKGRGRGLERPAAWKWTGNGRRTPSPAPWNSTHRRRFAQAETELEGALEKDPLSVWWRCHQSAAGLNPDDSLAQSFCALAAAGGAACREE